MTASDAASIIIFKQMFVYDTESRKGNGTMSENELALTEKDKLKMLISEMDEEQFNWFVCQMQRMLSE